MFEEFDWFLNDFETYDAGVSNYWSDVARDEAIEMIGKFTEEDWQALFSHIGQRSFLWKELLIDCLEDGNDPHQLKLLEDFLRADDDRLFISAVDALRCCFDVRAVRCDESIIKRIDHLLASLDTKTRETLMDTWTREILLEFKKKMAE